jgi:hypothetical protein
VFLEVTDEVVLSNCALSLVSLTRGDHARTHDTLNILKKTTNLLVKRLLDLCSAIPEDDQEEPESEGHFALLDSQRSLHLSLRRLRIISKLTFLPDLLSDSTTEKQHLEDIFGVVTDRLSKELADRKPITQENIDELEVPEIWSTLNEKIHSILATSVSDALDLLLSLTMWMVNKFVNSLKTQQDENDNDLFSEQAEYILKLRKFVTNLILLCFEHFIEPAHTPQVSVCQQDFSTLLQEYAMRVTGDLRMIFPKAWKAAKNKALASLALVDEYELVGGAVRFVRSQEDKVSFFQAVSLVLCSQ